MADDRYTLTDIEALAAHLETALARWRGEAPFTNIADAALGWAADHGWSQGARKHRGDTTASATVCPNTVRGKHAISRDPIFGTETFHNWPCVRAAGHDGDCQPDPEWETERVPFTELSAQELYDRLVLTAGQLRSERRSILREGRARAAVPGPQAGWRWPLMHTTALLLPLMLAARYGPGAAYTAVRLVRAGIVGAVQVAAAVASAGREVTR